MVGLKSLRRWFLMFIAFTALLTGVPSADAQDQEARRIRLNDGRQYDGLVLQSSAEGMLLQVPQGRTLVPYQDLAEISTITMKDFLSQEPIRLGLAPITAGGKDLINLAGHLDQWMIDAARTLPSTEVITATTWQNKIGVQLSACAGDPSCLRGLAEELDLHYLLVPTVTGHRNSRLKIGLTGFVASTGATVAAAGISFDLSSEHDPAAVGAELLGGLYAALGFQPGVDTTAIVA